MIISVVSLIEQDTALNSIDILKYWLEQWFSTLYIRITWGIFKKYECRSFTVWKSDLLDSEWSLSIGIFRSFPGKNV